MLPLPLSHILDPSLTAIGRLPARATLSAMPSTRMSLDGIWRFRLLKRPLDADDDWTVQDTSPDGWRDIQVPGVWTRQNTGNFPHYANVLMPFDCQKPPSIPEENPTGLYRTQFRVEADAIARRTILHTGGFESLALVWCNGSFVGLAKDSRLPSEFDLSDAVQEGDNDLAIMVMRWCDATWIEDQDHWNHGGLHRSVWIETRGETHIHDLIVDTDFEPTTSRGTASVRVEVSGPSAEHTITAHLEDDDGNRVTDVQTAPVRQFDQNASAVEQWHQTYKFNGYAATLALSLEGAEPWSAEHPKRYLLKTKMYDAAGACLEEHETWIGFTRIETDERRLRVNGRPIVLIGVNRHDHHPENGKTCSEGDIRAELLTMKRHNINAIRTAHYPNDPVLLDLADELGFYVIDEANVETHARWGEVAKRSDYHAAIVERTTRMITRDRNHPCIIGWSTGNEAGHGAAFDAAAAAARHLDPGRFVHYEGAVSMRLSFPFGKKSKTVQTPPTAIERAATDVVCPMYTPIDHMVAWAEWAESTKQDDRPFLLCEFSHAMGNSNGSITAYVDAFFEWPALAGGFVWDWRDQGLAETDEQGRFYWAYGGHFGDEPNDANFNINGLVGPDGVPHPALREYMWAARPVVSRWIEGRRVRCENRRVFTDTSDLVLDWQLSCNGVLVEQGRLNPVIAPGQRAEVELPINTQTSDAGAWYVTLSWRLATDEVWAKAEHLVAWDQIALTSAPIKPTLPRGKQVKIEDGVLTVAGQPLLASSITPCLWRAPTDNDGGKPGARPLFLNKTQEWVSYGLNTLSLTHRDWQQVDDASWSSQQTWAGSDGNVLQHNTHIRLTGDQVRFDETFIIPEAWEDLPRIGVRFELPRRLSELQWLGLGPDESYPDRCGAQTLGRWSSTIDDQYHPYVRPQEYGAHERCHWFRVLDAQGDGVQITLPQPVSFSARPHHDADLEAAETLAELTKAATTEVHIDIAMRGLGTAACGPDALPEYHVGPGRYNLSWILQAVSIPRD